MNKLLAGVIIIAELAGLILTLVERRRDITYAYRNFARKKTYSKPSFSDRLKRTHKRRK